MGMTYEQYWYGKPSMAKDFRLAHEIQRKQKSYDMWLAGLYHFTAVQTALANAFKEKGKPAYKFPERPLDEPEKERTAEEIRQEMYNRLKRFKENWDAKQGRTDN